MNTIITVVFTVTYLLIALFHCRGMVLRTKDLCMCSLMIALTLVLECIQIPLPTGARLPLVSMLPLMFLAVYNYKLAIFSGFVTGIMALLLVPGWQPVHWGQVFVEHMVCFSCIGFTGVLGSQTKKRLVAGFLVASVLKLCGHILSGVLFFSQNAWDGWGAWGYSISYNLSQNVPLVIMCGVVFFAIPLKTINMVLKVRDRT